MNKTHRLACAPGARSLPWPQRRRRRPAASLKLVPLAVALLLGGGAAWPQTYYRAQALPELPLSAPFGEGWTLGRALNDSGVVVGNSQSDSALRWSFLDGVRRLGGSPSQAFGIANDGTSVGYLNLGSSGGVIPVRWSPATGFAALGNVYAGAPVNGVAYAVNVQGWVLAADTTGQADNGMLLLRPGQDALNLGVGIGGRGFLGGVSLNQNGMVAGSIGFTNVAGQNTGQGFFWTEAGGTRTFGVAGGMPVVHGLNDNGLIVGRIAAAPGGVESFAGFVYDTGARTLRETLPGFWATSVNNAGAIAGTLWGTGPFSNSAALWRNGAAVNLNGLTADLGGYTLTDAIDINNSGQILAVGRLGTAPTDPNTPALRSYVLSECARCGQIRPYPVLSGSTLTVGSDWFDAFNAELLDNRGTLAISTTVLNRDGAELNNFGSLLLSGGLAGTLRNAGKLHNQAGASFDITGYFNNSGGTGPVATLENRGRITLGQHALVLNSGVWEQLAGSFEMSAGALINNPSAFFNVAGGSFSQSGGEITNSNGGIFRAVGTQLALHYFVNRGVLQFGRATHSPLTVVNIDGQLIQGQQGDAGDAFVFGLSSHHTLLSVRNGSYVHNAGTAELGQGSRWRIETDAAFALHGGRFNVGSGASLVVGADALGMTLSGGTLAVGFGAQVSVSAPLHLWAAGRIEVAGTLLLDTTAYNEVHVETQLGGSIRLLDGAVFINDQGMLDIALGSSLTGSQGSFEQVAGHTRVDGLLAAGNNSFSAGQISGRGVIEGNNTIGAGVTLDSRVTVRPGNSPGTLTFLGNTDFVNALVEIEIDARNSFDRLVVDGALNIGEMQVVLKPGAGWVPDLNDSFVWLVAPQASGNAPQIDTSALPAGWRAVSVNGGGTLDIWNDAAVALSPNPNPTGALLAVAAGTLAYNDPGIGNTYNNLGTVEVAGALANRPGALFMQPRDAQLRVLAGGRVSNRGYIGGEGGIDNAGLLINYADGDITVARLNNQGRIDNDGVLRPLEQFSNEEGAEVLNRGRIELPDSTFVNRGRFETHGQVRNPSLLINRGEFVVAEGGSVESVYFGAGEYRDSGGSTRVDGRLQASRIELNGTLLRGHGTLAGPVALGGAWVAPDAGRSLTIEGDLTGNASFYLSWLGAGVYSRLHVTGNLELGPGTVFFVLAEGGWVPQAGERVEWLSVDGDARGLDTLDWRIVVQAADASCLGCELVDWTPPSDMRVSFDGAALSLQPVPEPGTWAMLAIGLAALGLWARRRRPTTAVRT